MLNMIEQNIVNEHVHYVFNNVWSYIQVNVYDKTLDIYTIYVDINVRRHVNKSNTREHTQYT